jgi:hypothetical protein
MGLREGHTRTAGFSLDKSIDGVEAALISAGHRGRGTQV